jgi:peptidoglycan/xylan/chitin deacetylase (PgdA/CDA1 family)
MYHYVHDSSPALDSSDPGRPDGVRGLSRAEFCSQLDRLCSAREPIDWATLYAWTTGTRNVPDRSFLLTFDDGLLDHAEVVAPILEGRGLRGVFFVPGAILAAHNMLPAHMIHVLLSRLKDVEFTEELHRGLLAVAGGREWARRLRDLVDAPEGSLDDIEGRRLYHYESTARARLKFFLTMTIPIALRNDVVASLFTRHVGSSQRWARHWYLSWDDLVRMRSKGHTIGGHGDAHEPYSRLTPDERRRDLLRTAAILREGLGHDLRPFSFPYGRATDDPAQLARDTGFVHAFGTEPRCMVRTDSPFDLPRVDTIHVDALLEPEKICRPR